MNDTQTPSQVRGGKLSRNYLYGRSRANRWPLWTSWLLAGSRDTRLRVRTLMQLKRDGFDV